MKVVLIQSPGLRKLEVYQSIGVRVPPLGLALIAGIPEREGYKVSIIDAPTLGLGPKEAVERALSENPDVIGISSVTPTVNSAYLMTSLIKERDPNIPVVLGGPHVSFMREEALDNGADYVVVGEGEHTVVELMRYLETGIDDPHEIKGIAFKEDGKTFFTGWRPLINNLDELPKPARHLLPMDKYTVFDKPIRILHVIATRGCPYGCIYCSTSYYWGRRYRTRSPHLVAEEIEEAIDKYSTKTIIFSDDELTLNKKWLRNLMKEFRERKLDVSWTCGSRVNSVDRELLKEMAEHGCNTIYYGIESYSQEDIDRIGKRIRIEQVWNAIRNTKEAGIDAVGSFILGFPWQTVEDMKKTVSFAKKLGLDYAQFTVATPFPGTPLYNTAKRQGLIEVENWDYYTTIYPVMRGYYFTRSQLEKMIAWAYRSFYLRPRFIISQFKKGRTKAIIEIILRTLKSYFKKQEIEEEKTYVRREKRRKIETTIQ